MTAFRAENVEDKTILNYFDEIEIHPKIFPAEEPIEELFSKVKDLVGAPRNYGLSLEEIEAKAISEAANKVDSIFTFFDCNLTLLFSLETKGRY